MARGELISEDEAAARTESEAANLEAAWAAFGLRVEQDKPVDMPEFYLLPECVPVFDLWMSVQTQWRVGVNGPTGLDYQAVEAYMRMSHNPLRRDPSTIRLIRAMEVSTLKVMSEKRAAA